MNRDATNRGSKVTSIVPCSPCLTVSVMGGLTRYSGVGDGEEANHHHEKGPDGSVPSTLRTNRQ